MYLIGCKYRGRLFPIPKFTPIKYIFFCYVMNGYIKLFNRFLYWEWYTNQNTKAVFLHILLKANYKPKRWQGLTIQRGQLVTSLKSLSQELGLNIGQIRTALNNIQNSKEITRKTTNKYTIITVCKYECYQGSNQANNTQNDTQTTRKTTNEQQQLKNKKNKEKNKQKETRKNLVDELPTEADQYDARQNTALPFDIVTANQTLKNLDPAEIAQTYKNIFGSEFTAEQYARALNTFCTVGVATYQKYKGIRTLEKLKNLFIQWINKNINYQNNRPKHEAPELTADDLRAYYQKNYSKRWNELNQNTLKDYCLKFTNWLPTFTETKKELKNDTLDEIVLFFVTFRTLGDGVSLSPNPQRRLNAFKRWFSRLSDYNQRKGDIKKLLQKENDRQRLA
jgi:hypothetical protein